MYPHPHAPHDGQIFQPQAIHSVKALLPNWIPHLKQCVSPLCLAGRLPASGLPLSIKYSRCLDARMASTFEPSGSLSARAIRFRDLSTSSSLTSVTSTFLHPRALALPLGHAMPNQEPFFKVYTKVKSRYETLVTISVIPSFESYSSTLLPANSIYSPKHAPGFMCGF